MRRTLSADRKGCDRTASPQKESSREDPNRAAPHSGYGTSQVRSQLEQGQLERFRQRPAPIPRETIDRARQASAWIDPSRERSARKPGAERRDSSTKTTLGAPQHRDRLRLQGGVDPNAAHSDQIMRFRLRNSRIASAVASRDWIAIEVPENPAIATTNSIRFEKGSCTSHPYHEVSRLRRSTDRESPRGTRPYSPPEAYSSSRCTAGASVTCTMRRTVSRSRKMRVAWPSTSGRRAVVSPSRSRSIE